jgi:hypothetical protein
MFQRLNTEIADYYQISTSFEYRYLRQVSLIFQLYYKSFQRNSFVSHSGAIKL